ncbi:hypothetical protein FGG08_003678 [Glutinoglossum americanum]|uniref:Uncharacterized protein n=1 Tax=Glutinoglossum americanum TaxID=1670608 RepID=A0A9P8I3U4_9PEZI|nr:hypothetical protein FGG08_003678 [Glutinoglossum americanum]
MANGKEPEVYQDEVWRFYPGRRVVAMRDLQRCEIKYGEDWQEYKRRVPYLFIPVSSADSEHQHTS